jgi:hypothetical protein
MVCNSEVLHIEGTENPSIFVDAEIDSIEFREFLKKNGIEVEQEKEMICG